MFPSSTIRSTTIILLMLPLLHLAWLISVDLQRYLEPSPSTWNRDLESVVETDMNTTLPEHPVLIIGGQRVRRWEGLPDAFVQGATLRRALGDATLEDLTHHYDRLVAFYRPAVLVIFPAYADLHLRDDKTPDEFMIALTALLDRDQEYARNRQRVLLTPLLTPLHPADADRVAAMAALARRLAAQEDQHLRVIDPNRALQRADGSPDPAFFRIDGINLNSAGYAAITALLETSLAQQGTTREF